MKTYRVTIFCLLLIILSCFSVIASEQRVVRVGAFNFYPGIFKDSDGTIKGFYVDALADIARRENIRFEYVYGSWNEGLERIKSGEVDLLTSVAYTAERAEFLDYVKTPLLTVWGELYVPLASEIDGIRTVQGTKIAVMKGDFNARNFIDLVKKFDITCEFVEMPGFEEVFRAVAAKEVDAGVVNSTFGAAKQTEYGLRSTGIVFNPFDIFFAVAKGKNSDLQELLDSYLHSWRHQADSPFNIARQKWSHGNRELRVIPPWLKASLALSAVLALSAFAFIVILRKQVLTKTRSAVESAQRYQAVSERQDALLAAIPDIIMEVDADKVYTWANRAGREFFGQDVIGKPASSYFAGDQDTYGMVSPLFEGDESILYVESWQRRSDGEIRLLAWWCKALVNTGGTVTGTLSTARDITEYKRVEESLREANAYLENLINYANAPIIVWNRHFRITRFNHAFEALTGRSDSEVIGQPLEILFPPALIDSSMALIHKTLSGERWESVEIMILHSKGSVRTVLWNSATLFAEDGETPLATIAQGQDITERKQAEEALQLKNSEMERFTYSVSHDLKSPLITIQSYAGMIAKDIAFGNHERALGDMKRIESAAAKMTALINDLLELSRAGKIISKSLPVDMNRLVGDTLQQLAGSINSLAVDVVVQPDLPLVHGDPKRIAEVVQNLIENAIKYRCEQSSPRIEIGTRLDGKETVFFVRDNGAGIDPQQHEKIFGLFTKLDSKSEGTGIGLALVKRIMEAHGGRIWVESEGLGTGSCFCLTFEQK